MEVIDLLNYWLKITNFNSQQTSFKIFTNDYKFHEKNKKIIKFFNEYDSSGIIPLLYAKMAFIDLINTSQFTLLDLLQNNIENFDEIKILYNEFNSDKFVEFEKEVIQRFETILVQLNVTNLIGNLSVTNLLTCTKNVLEDILSLNFDVYKKGGIVKSFDKFSGKIHVFETLSKCLLTLENSDDAVYLCYISKENSPDGYFGLYIKNNGNLFSINERINEKYIGQHKNMRSNRYTSDKKYDLFPYDIFEFLGEDYKGYATEHKIDESKLNFNNLNTESLMNIIIMIYLLNQKYVNKNIDSEEVYINSLFDVNVKPMLELNKCELIPYANNSSLVKTHKNFEINFSKEAFLDGSLCNEFNYSSDKKYNECGCFKNINQGMVEKFGKDFDLDTVLKNVFETDRTALLLDSDVNGELKKRNVPFNNEYIGNKRQMELQAFYLTRKKLAQHIYDKQIESLEKFGGVEKLKEWYHNLLINNLDMIVQKCIEVYNNPSQGKMNIWCGIGDKHEVNFNFIKYSNTDDHDTYMWCTLNNVCNNINHIKYPYTWGDRIQSKDLFNQKECFHWFQFNPINYKHLNEFFNVEFPDFCEGYWIPTHGFKPYTGNSILDIVDPVDELDNVLCYKNSNKFVFSFSIGFSKSTWNKIKKGK